MDLGSQTMVPLAGTGSDGAMTNNPNHQTLVIGGTGKTGRRMAERLAGQGGRVRVASRRTDPVFDWDEPATWRRAVAGCDAAYVTFAPDLAFPGAAEKLGAFAAHAVDAGVERFVLLS